MKRVLLTGATGFIGRHSIPLLEASGYRVEAVSSHAWTGASGSGVNWHQADLLDPRQIASLMTELRPSHLLHLAWYAEPGKYWTSTENLRWVKASLDLLESFQACGGERVVMAGTCSEYDWGNGNCSELTTPLQPTTLYGSCKHALQVILAAFARQTGLSAAWGRLFFLYGPHEPRERLVASVIRSLLLNEPARCSHGNQQRDYLYVEDTAAALVSLLNSDVRGPINLASGKAVSLKEIILQIAKTLNRSDLVQLGAIPVSPDEPALIVADVQRLQNEVGWAPRYDLNSGLESTIEWWKRELSSNESL